MFISFGLSLLITIAASGAVGGAATTRPAIEFEAGENRIVLVGSGLMEQARASGFLEARLMRSVPLRLMRSEPDWSIICRNLGWSGDSVTGAARVSGYENPAGMDRLIKETSALKPTMIFVGYGSVESFGGQNGLAEFVENYKKLLDALGRITPRMVLISPACQEPLTAAHNADLEEYTKAIAQIADERKLPFVDLFHPLIEFEKSHPDARLTTNGIILNDTGYWLFAYEIDKQLGIQPAQPNFQLQADGKSLAATGVAVNSVERTDSTVKFEISRTNLPAPQLPEALSSNGISTDHFSLTIKGLEKGEWTLSIDGQEIMHADARALEAGQTLATDPDRQAADDLRRAIIRSNALFYRRERPYNDQPRHFTYIEGDFALYDQQLAALDETISSLRKPKAHQFKLVRTSKP